MNGHLDLEARSGWARGMPHDCGFQTGEAEPLFDTSLAPVSRTTKIKKENLPHRDTVESNWIITRRQGFSSERYSEK